MLSQGALSPIESELNETSHFLPIWLCRARFPWFLT